jgi:hypothetical protein
MLQYRLIADNPHPVGAKDLLLEVPELPVDDPGGAVVEDFAPSVASYFAPAAFIAAPVRLAGSTIGVLACSSPSARSIG